eukprot:scaffold501_cov355-Pinguiococcus_pyrenoidosus.AAC.6
MHVPQTNYLASLQRRSRAEGSEKRDVSIQQVDPGRGKRSCHRPFIVDGPAVPRLPPRSLPTAFAASEQKIANFGSLSRGVLLFLLAISAASQAKSLGNFGMLAGQLRSACPPRRRLDLNVVYATQAVALQRTVHTQDSELETPEAHPLADLVSERRPHDLGDVVDADEIAHNALVRVCTGKRLEQLCQCVLCAIRALKHRRHRPNGAFHINNFGLERLELMEPSVLGLQERERSGMALCAATRLTRHHQRHFICHSISGRKTTEESVWRSISGNPFLSAPFAAALKLEARVS